MTFYRVLTSNDAIQRWNRCDYTASHCLVPGEWSDMYYRQGRRAPADFPLGTRLAAYSQAALESFLRLAPNYVDGAIWAQSDRCAVSEVDGVCAWRTPQQALEYARVGNAAFFRIAVFDGVETGPLPEPGGVCARVNAKIELLDVAAFDAKYCRMPAV